MMLIAVPKGWFSWDFQLLDMTNHPVAELELSSWRERGSVLVGGASYKLYREGLAGPFVLEAPDGAKAGSAVKISVFRQEFSIAHAELNYRLKAISAWRREFGLFLEDRRIGSIEPESWTNRKAKVDFADDVPLLLQAFAIWLTLLQWRNAAAVAAAGGG